MGRPRKSPSNLPPCVYRKHGAFYYVRGGRWVPLGRDLANALAEYARLSGTVKGSMPDLIDTAFASFRKGLSDNTVRQYTIAVRKLKHIFEEFSPEQVQGRHVAQVKLALAKTPNMANRVLSVLRQVFDYAVEQQIVDNNPAAAIKRHKEAKRTRLLSWEEFSAIRAQAGPRLQVIMDLAYLTGQRIGDVLKIRVSDLGEDGVFFQQQKEDSRLVVRWTPELRAVVDRAKALGGNVRALTLLYNRRGKAPDYRTIADQWRIACTASGVADATLHDLRAMAATTVGKERAQALLGHASATNTARYLRSKEVPVVDGPKRRVLDI